MSCRVLGDHDRADAASSCAERQRAPAASLVVGHDQDVGEEPVDRRAELRQVAERRAGSSAAPAASSTRGIRVVQLVEQRHVRPARAACRRRSCRSAGGCSFSSAAMFLTRLNGRRQLRELRRRARTAPSASTLRSDLGRPQAVERRSSPPGRCAGRRPRARARGAAARPGND